MENISSEMEGSGFTKISDLKITYQNRSFDLVQSTALIDYINFSRGEFVFLQSDGLEIVRTNYIINHDDLFIFIETIGLPLKLLHAFEPFFKKYKIYLF